MDFDKSRIFTALNADELKIGSKIIGANSLATLQQRVVTLDRDKVCEELTWIGGEHLVFRFQTVGNEYILAYLIEELQQELKWTDLKLGDIIRRKDSTIHYIVVAIDINPDEKVEYEDEGKHIRISGLGWISDYLLKDFEIVKE